MFQELVSNITNVGVFTESFGEWISGISINSAIVDMVKSSMKDLMLWDLWQQLWLE